MINLKELGKLFKKDNPQYADMPNKAAGLMLVRARPDLYGYLEEDIITNQPPDKMHHYESELHKRIDSLWKKHNPNMGIIMSWWRRNKVEAQNRYLTAADEQLNHLVSQYSILINQAYQMAEHVAREQRREHEFLSFLAENEELITVLLTNAKLMKDAAEHGLNFESYVEVQKTYHLTEIERKNDQLKHDREIELERITEEKADAQHARKLEADRQQANLDIKKYREKAAIDLENEVESAYQKLKFEVTANNLSKQQEIVFIQTLIDEQFVEIANTWNSTTIPETAKEDIVKSRQRIIEMFMRQQNETQDRILNK